MRRSILKDISLRHPDDGEEVWTRRVAWEGESDREEYESARSRLRDEVLDAYAQGVVEGVRVLRGEILYVWDSDAVRAIETEAAAHGDFEMVSICQRYLTEDSYSEEDRDAIWEALDHSFQEDELVVD
jgi:hypothetical protein